MKAIHEEHTVRNRHEIIVFLDDGALGDLAEATHEIRHVRAGQTIGALAQRAKGLAHVGDRALFVGAAPELEKTAHAVGEGRVVALDRRHVHLACIVPMGVIEHLYAAEVDEPHLSVGGEEVVSRMRIGVEHPADERALENEAPERLGPGDSLFLRRLHRFFERDAASQLGRENALRRTFVDHLGDADSGVAPMELGEEALALRLEAIVELLGEARADLVVHATGLELSRRAGEVHGPLDQAGVFEVGLHGGGHPVMLHLHRDRPSVVELGSMHLTDGGAGERLVFETREDLGRWRPELLLDGPLHRFR